MNFLLLGFASMLDVLANLVIFSGYFSTAFSVVEAAEFSTVLGIVTVLSSLLFGGAEALVDHKKFLPKEIFFRYTPRALLIITTLLLLFQTFYEVLSIAWIPLLVTLQGLRNIGRASNYALSKFFKEVAVTLAELLLMVFLIKADNSIAASYLVTRLFGVAGRAQSIVTSQYSGISLREFIGYSFSAVTPALYFNLYYTFLPYYASPDLIVRFRYVQSALVPISFLGSLLSRAKIIFYRDSGEVVSKLGKGYLVKRIGYVVLPFAISFIYLYALRFISFQLDEKESFVIGVYTGLIFHRSQMYAQITLMKGAALRGLVGVLGVAAIGLSIPPLGLLSEIRLIYLFTALCLVESFLLAICLVLLKDCWRVSKCS